MLEVSVMGVDTTATSSSFDDHASLLRELYSHGLCENLRKCKMAAWKTAFEVCTGQDVIDLEWSTASPETVKVWAMSAREHIKNHQNSCSDDEKRICKYLSACARNNASIEFH